MVTEDPGKIGSIWFPSCVPTVRPSKACAGILPRIEAAGKAKGNTWHPIAIDSQAAAAFEMQPLIVHMKYASLHYRCDFSAGHLGLSRHP